MNTRQSNIIPVIHRLVTDVHGENYWFNGCAKYAMECLGEKDFDYEFFAGLTGDVFTQHYSHTNLASESASGYLQEEDPARFAEETFSKCGYSATYVSAEDALKDTEKYKNMLIDYIDRGIPVISCGGRVGVYVGYEDFGNVLLYITGNSDQTERVPLEKVFEPRPFHGHEYASGWIFVGGKNKDIPLADIYRRAIRDIVPLQSIKTDTYCFGPEAFRAWAHDIEGGKFDNMTAEEFDTWCGHTNYVCVLATNGSCCHGFLKRAQELNPDMVYLTEIGCLYRRMAQMWGGDRDQNDEDSLEALGGGFNVTLEILQDKEQRGKIAAKVLAFADVTDEIVRILQENR